MHLAVQLCIRGYYFTDIFFQSEEQEVVVQKNEETKGTSSFTFLGVGDNLIHQAIYSQYEAGDTDYDFGQDYALIEPYVKEVDFAYINQETICAGEEYGLSHYPMFNGPTQILDATFDSGFDWISVCSNHSLDKGVDGLNAQLEYIADNYKDVSVTGAYKSEKESKTYTVRDINGIKVGLLSYTYGLNGMVLPEGYEWMVELIDEDQIKDDMEELSKISDVQIVSMHWGTEYSTVIEEDQRDLAQKMNEWGVEVIIGTHPHVIKHDEVIEGDKQDTLCYYSLGNFLSARDTNDRMVGGMESFTLNYDFDTQKTSFEDVKFTPTVMYFEPTFTTFQAMTFQDYDNSYAPSHYCTALGYDMSKEWIQSYVEEIMSESKGVEVVL